MRDSLKGAQGLGALSSEWEGSVKRREHMLIDNDGELLNTKTKNKQSGWITGVQDQMIRVFADF